MAIWRWLFSRHGRLQLVCSRALHSSSQLQYPRRSSLPQARALLVEQLRAQAKERLSIESAVEPRLEAGLELDTPEQEMAIDDEQERGADAGPSLDLTCADSIRAFIEAVGGHRTQVVMNELDAMHAAASCMIVTESNNSRARRAIAERFWQAFKRATKEQGPARDFFLQQRHTMVQSDWLAYDLGTFFLHIMSAEARQKYNLESLWSGAESSRPEEDPFAASQSDAAVFEFDRK